MSGWNWVVIGMIVGFIALGIALIGVAGTRLPHL